MKITRSDIGSTFLVTSWSRGRRGDDSIKELKLEGVGRVNLVLSGVKYRINSQDEFSVQASERDPSDSNITIYRSAKDMGLKGHKEMLIRNVNQLLGDKTQLNIDQLEKIINIIK